MVYFDAKFAKFLANYTINIKKKQTTLPLKTGKN